MRITSKRTGFYQEGGAIEEQPMEQDMGGQDPIMEVLMVAEEALQTQNCEASMAVCQALLELASGGGEGGAPEEMPMEEPQFARQGTKLVRRR